MADMLDEDKDIREVTCQCGWRCRGTLDQVVEQVQAHGREAHGVEATREEILEIAYPVTTVDGS
jgi:predicted small metal-binding protein